MGDGFWNAESRDFGAWQGFKFGFGLAWGLVAAYISMVWVGLEIISRWLIP